jgi:hypothetical protein
MVLGLQAAVGNAAVTRHLQARLLLRMPTATQALAGKKTIKEKRAALAALLSEVTQRLKELSADRERRKGSGWPPMPRWHLS